MRLMTSHAGRDRTQRAPGLAFAARRAFLFLIVFLLLPATLSLVAAPSKPTSRPAQKRGVPVAAVATTPARHNRPEMAVVYDDTYRPPAKDLLLTLDGERKADAAVHFVTGLLDEEANPDTANEQYQKSLGLDPGNAELSIKLAQDDVRKGDVPAAINLLKDTIKAVPKQAKPYLALAYIYYNQQNKADLAQKYIQEALDLDPALIRGYDYLRTIYKDTKQTDKISPLLDRAAKVDTDDASFWLYLGKLYIEQYLSTEANLAPGEPLRKTTGIFQKAFDHGKNDSEIVDKVADFLFATRQFKEAIPVYERVIEMEPAQVSPRENLARCYLAVEQPDKAAEALEGLIKVNPVDDHAYQTLAEIYKNSGKFDKAIASYEQSLLINPNYAEGYQNVTDLLLQQKKADKAIPLLADARKRFPGQPGYTFLLAIAQEAANQHKDALATYEQAETEGLRSLPVMLDSQFYFRYGVSAEQAGLYDRAGILFKKALGMEDEPKRIALISNYLGYMWVDHGTNLEEGGELIKRALEIDPENGAYRDSLGWYYYRMNQFPEAVAELTKAAEVTQPEDSAVYDHLGDAYLKANDPTKAIAAWQKAVDLHDTSTDATAINKKIVEAKAAPSLAPAPKG